MSTQTGAGAGTGSDAKQYTQADVDRLVAEASTKAHGEGAATATADAKQITALCLLAGCPEKAADFIAKNTPVAKVQEGLMAAAAAKDEPEIDGHKKNEPGEAQNGAMTGAMLNSAVDKLVAQMGGK